MGKLKRLKFLDLSYCRFLNKNYNGAIGKCQQLEELYFLGWAQQEYYSQCVVDVITLPMLQRFVIHIFGHRHYARTATRVLYILDYNISNLRPSRKNLLQIAEIVSLEHLHGGCKNIIPDMFEVVGGINRLTCLRLDSCQEIECIFDTTTFDYELVHPKLMELELVELKNLKELCRGPALQVLHFFDRLKKLEIWNCLQLRSIFPQECNLQNLTILIIQDCKFVESLFSMFVAQSLQQLEVLEIARCNELKHIIANEKENGSTYNPSNEIVQLPILGSSNFLMPRLKKLRIVECKKLESIFSIWSVEGLAALEEIQIVHVPKLKLVFGQCDTHQYHSSQQYQNQDMCLKFVRLEDLENLVGICPENNRANWPLLTVLSVKNCPKLTASWIATMVGSKESEKTVQIEELTLRGFSGLSLISRVGSSPGQILNCQCLVHLKMGECENLKSLFSMEVHRCLPKLMSLKIYECRELEQIIAENEGVVQLPNADVCFPKLIDIGVYNCNKLKSLFSFAMVRMLPQLGTLIISGATQLQVVFRHGSGDDTINESQIVLPELKRIELHELPSFVDICKGFKLKAVKLKRAHIDGCPNIAPSLREIQVQLLKTQGYDYDRGDYFEDTTDVEDQEEKDFVI